MAGGDGEVLERHVVDNEPSAWRQKKKRGDSETR
jgi:hypothetical protein